MQQIKSFGVLQTSKVIGVSNFLIGILVAIGFMVQFVMNHGLHHPPVLLFFLFVPILYGVGGFVVTAIFCAIYNWVARHVGGIAIELAP
jgi:hypothetical protein